MKVISLLQPWASLVVIGAKKIETRSWNTKYRGPLLIHASKKKIPELRSLLCSWNFDAAFHSLGGTMSPGSNLELPLGSIIGMVHLDNCRPTDSFTVAELDTKVWHPDGRTSYYTERQLGDYSPGRYGWLLSNPHSFSHHIPVKGSLGLWEYDGRLCLKCGCTDYDCRHCIEKTGRPCHWVAKDLCSACVGT